MKSDNSDSTQEIIGPVTREALEAAAHEGKVDAGTEKLLSGEREYICKRREHFRTEEERHISAERVP